MHRHKPALVSSLLVVLVSAGCGGSAPGPATEDAAIKRIMRTYITALADGDGERACGQLTSAAKRQVVTQLAAILSERGATTCAEVLGGLAARMPDVMRDQFPGAKIAVTHHGDSATAGAPGYEQQHAQLRRINGRWLISRYRVPQAAP